MPFVYCSRTDGNSSELIVIKSDIIKRMAQLLDGNETENYNNLVALIKSYKAEISSAITCSHLDLVKPSAHIIKKHGEKEVCKALKLSRNLQESLKELQSGFYQDNINSVIYSAPREQCDAMLEVWENIEGNLKDVDLILAKALHENKNIKAKAGALKKLKGLTYFVGLFAIIYEQISLKHFTFNPHYNADGIYTKGQEFVLTATECIYVEGFSDKVKFTDKNFQSACSYVKQDINKFRKMVKTF